ncbi:MAG: hypothetical protein V5789_00715 [Colwellia sp.]
MPKKRPRLKRAKISPDGFKEVAFTKFDMGNALLTPQKHVVFAFGGNIPDVSFIGTTGMGPCIGFCLYHKGTLSAAACHFDSDAAASSKFEAYDVGCSVIERFQKGAGKSAITARIIIGSSPEGTGDKIVGYLADACEDYEIEVEYYRAKTGDWAVQVLSGKMVGCAVPGFTYSGDNNAVNFKSLAMRSKGSPATVVISRLEVPLTATLKFRPWNQL